MRTTAHTYRIRIEGHLSDNWACWFEGLNIRRKEDGDTVLSGELPDQTALHGVLMVIRDLGLVLLEVKCVDPKTKE